MRRLLITACASLMLLLPCSAKGKSDVLDLKHSITDSKIVYPESFEVDAQKMMEGWYLKNYTATDTRYRDVDDAETTDTEITERLAALPTVIEMPFNQIVRSYIDRYTKRGRAQVATLLGLNLYYMPIFEQALEERGLPLELKYLPVIESGLDPNAVSKHGATGLWQFMLATARGLGLEVSSLVDERRDPYVSSAKAADYLQDLYATYNDWGLAIAAYNCGPGAVNKAIRRAGGDPKSHDYWSIYNYLSPETRGYVPMFIAANYVMNYYPKHNISPVLPTKPLVTDTIRISERLHLNQISSVLDIPMEELRILNPQFRADIIPGSSEHPYNLILPSQQIHAFIMSEETIRRFDEDKYAQRLSVEPGSMPSDAVLAEAEMENPADNIVAELADAPTAAPAATASGTTLTHKVAPGESLASIAEKYNVKPADIKNWNSLRRNAVRTGQILRITAPADYNNTAAASTPTPAASTTRSSQTASASKSSASKSSASKQTAAGKSSKASKTSKTSKKQKAAPANVDHKLKSGDNLTTLSKKYGVSVEEIKKANNLKGDNLRAGDNIKIPTKGTSTSKSSKKSKSTSSKSKKKSSSKKKRR